MDGSTVPALMGAGCLSAVSGAGCLWTVCSRWSRPLSLGLRSRRREDSRDSSRLLLCGGGGGSSLGDESVGSLDGEEGSLGGLSLPVRRKGSRRLPRLAAIRCVGRSGFPIRPAGWFLRDLSSDGSDDDDSSSSSCSDGGPSPPGAGATSPLSSERFIPGYPARLSRGGMPLCPDCWTSASLIRSSTA